MERLKTTVQNKTSESQHGSSSVNARIMQAVPVLQKTAPDEDLLQKNPNNTGLPDNLKSGIENLSGYSLDDVKVHYNSDKPTQLQALAYAQGTDIHVAPGQEKHLPHEAWHVVQQKQGRVQPTLQMKEGVAVNDDKGLESEADVMGRRAMQIKLEENNNNPQVKETAQLQSMEVKPSNKIVIQKRKYTDKQIKDEIKFIPEKTNYTKIMLAVYNQMRFEIDPTPEKFNNIKEGREAMIKAGKFDSDDADFLDAEVTRIETAGSNPTKLIELQAIAKINEKFDAVDAKYGQHIFQGDFKKGSPTGFHSKADGSKTHEAYGTKTDVNNKGAYQQSVRSKGEPSKKKTNQSTFFPDNATHQNIIKAIASVYEAGFTNVSYVAPTVNGLSLAKRGDTVFPAGGSDSLVAEE
ncbi:MAG: EndoU domain-containing protein [Bacteroidota bacterium]|nr:EndoU domain-containing protein [Bacteroidota bacterium]